MHIRYLYEHLARPQLNLSGFIMRFDVEKYAPALCQGINTVCIIILYRHLPEWASLEYDDVNEYI